MDGLLLHAGHRAAGCMTPWPATRIRLEFMEWKSIKTAPDDDTVVDIWSPTDGRLANYRREQISPTNVFYDPVESGVCCVRDATHWMKIEPPKQN